MVLNSGCGRRSGRGDFAPSRLGLIGIVVEQPEPIERIGGLLIRVQVILAECDRNVDFLNSPKRAGGSFTRLARQGAVWLGKRSCPP
jgi:hypothetical protein